MNEKVIQFNVGSDYYITKAIDAEIEGDIAMALYYAKRALEYEPEDVYLTLKTASYYEVMELYAEANDIYFKIIKENGPVLHCLYSLTDNMLSLGDTDAAEYYASQYTSIADTQEDIAEIEELWGKHSEEFRIKECRLVPDYVNHPTDKRFYKGLEYMQDGDVANAFKVFQKVPIDSMDGFEAKKLAVECCLIEERDEDAMKLLLKMKEFQPSSVYVYRMLLMLSHKYHREEMIPEIIRCVTDLTPEDRYERIDLIMVYTRLEMFDKALGLCTEYCEDYPYDLEMKKQLGIIYYDLEDYLCAADCFTDVMRISDPLDLAKYFKELSLAQEEKKKKGKEKPLPLYSADLPQSECKRRYLYITRSVCGGMAGGNMLWEDEEFKRCVKFLFCSQTDGGDELKADLADLLSHMRSAKQCGFYEELMMQSCIPDSSKRLIMHYLAGNSYSKELMYVYRNVIAKITLDTNTASYPEVFREAYQLMTAMVTVVLPACSTAMRRQFKKVLKRYHELGKNYKLSNVLAATILITMAKAPLEETTLCDIFHCKQSQINKYREELEL